MILRRNFRACRKGDTCQLQRVARNGRGLGVADVLHHHRPGSANDARSGKCPLSVTRMGYPD